MLKEYLKNHYVNIPGWRTNRKLVVIESDDWGSIRMPSKEVQEKFVSLGYKLNDPYNQMDTLANSEDLLELFDALRKHRDSKGSHPIITFNAVMGNPDFEKIKAGEYAEYHYEPFTETLKRYYPNEDVFSLWKQGIEEGLIQPQFHGREHVNVPVWLGLLQEGNRALLDAFELGFWGIPPKYYNSKSTIQAAYRSSDKKNIEMYKIAVKEGLNLFEETFGFRSKTFIANNYTWPMELNPVLSKEGVVGLQCMHYHKIPKENDKSVLFEIYTGKKNQYNQFYTLRNCQFEPSQTKTSFDDLGECLKQIKTAFFWKKPAVITTHRLNFIGSLDVDNRKDNFKKINRLLQEIISRWPDVEFISSDQLAEIVKKQQ